MSEQNKLTLAVTTIGDLLINKQISNIGDNKPLKDVNLIIPEYQRPYKWTVKNANQLLDDIVQAMNAKKEVYRVGTLILYYNKENQRYEIVDGQQRTITFSLLIKALDKNEDIDFLNQQITDNQYNQHNVATNYRAFVRRFTITSNDNEKGKRNHENEYLKDFIKTHCELIVVITNDLSEAFQFFDSQNARGKALYPHDLLKAYHLREMRNISLKETEETVKTWEDFDQKKLSNLFAEYLYRLKEWIKGNYATSLNEKNIDIFKGLTTKDNYPYAQYYKGAFAYADGLNSSEMSFVTGSKLLKPFQINAPVIAGKPFFDYTKHYFDLLFDIKNNDKYYGYFINGNPIAETLNLYYNKGTGNRITRLMFDTAVLLYVDRFCPMIPDRTDLDLFEHFVNQAFIWAYSMRAQYYNVGWLVAQNYVMGESPVSIKNSFNIYKIIADADSPNALISNLSDRLNTLGTQQIKADMGGINIVDDETDNGVFKNYLHYFKTLNFWEGKK
ncbi:MAG: DUF262 domain-containing protein [Bacteroidales bacterium]|nr:DUF262 domain-containing protein [Bacteroidales bacterium]